MSESAQMVDGARLNGAGAYLACEGQILGRPGGGGIEGLT